MSPLSVTVVVLALCAPLLCSSSDVLEFTNANFNDGIAKLDIALVEFYAPWCGHCKRLAPEYEKAATKLAANDPPVALAKVDCTSEKDTCDKFGVSGFPTLKIFRNGEVSADYQGPREADGIVKYMRGQAGPSSKELKTKADFEKFVKNDEASVIGFFKEETKLRDSFMKVADTERDRFRFAHTSAEELIKMNDATDDIIAFRPPRMANKFEEAHARYDGNYDTDKIKKFLNTEIQGLAGERTSDNGYEFAARPLVTVYYNMDWVKDPKGTAYWRNRVLKVAKEFKRKVHFCVAHKDDFSGETDQFGFQNKDAKVLVAAYGPAGEKFPMNDEFSVDSLRSFAEGVLEGKVTPYMKSEPVPKQDGPVTIAVAKNMKELLEEKKDMLIEFYAPWCGHCKSLAPIYDELGEKMTGEDVIIAKMDATANDVDPRFSVSGFPTIYWVPAGGSPMPYNSGRELDAFVKFISQNASKELKGFDRSGKRKKGKKTEL